MAVVFDHAVRIDAEPGDALRFRLQPRPDVHPAGVEPDEERLLRIVRPVDEAEGRRKELLVHCLHALLVERPRVLAVLLAPLPEAGVLAWNGLGRRGAAHHPARPKFLAELRAFGIVGMLRLVLGVEVVEVAEELIEAVHGGQELVAVAEMVLAELTGHVAERLQEVGDGRIRGLQALGRAGQSDLQQPGAHRALPGDEGGAAGGAGLLAVIVGENPALLGQPVDVGGAVAHLAAVIGGDVPVADVVAHDDEDIGFGAGVLRQGGKSDRSKCERQRRGHVSYQPAHGLFRF